MTPSSSHEPRPLSPDHAHLAAATAPRQPHLASPLAPRPSQESEPVSASQSLPSVGFLTKSTAHFAPSFRPFQIHPRAPSSPSFTQS